MSFSLIMDTWFFVRVTNYTALPLFLVLCHWLTGRVVGVVRWTTTGCWCGMKGPFLEQSTERAAVRQSGWRTCGVTEEGDMLCDKVVAAMWVFPQIYVVPADGPFVLKYVVQTPCILIIKPLVMIDRLLFHIFARSSSYNHLFSNPFLLTIHNHPPTSCDPIKPWSWYSITKQHKSLSRQYTAQFLYNHSIKTANTSNTGSAFTVMNMNWPWSTAWAGLGWRTTSRPWPGFWSANMQLAWNYTAARNHIFMHESWAFIMWANS